MYNAAELELIIILYACSEATAIWFLVSHNPPTCITVLHCYIDYLSHVRSCDDTHDCEYDSTEKLYSASFELRAFDSIWKWTIRTLDLSNLIPHLTKCRLLLRNGTDALTKSELTCQDCIKKFLLILQAKGQGWYIVIVAVFLNVKP